VWGGDCQVPMVYYKGEGIRGEVKWSCQVLTAM
jgi:hypothetical protein